MLDNFYDVIIVGGGFSGLVACLNLKRQGVKAIVLEKLDRVGKKILATGNGRGNITNTNLSLDNYHGDKSFIEPSIKKYDNNSLMTFFSELGLTFTEENGKVYPSSLQANAILDCLRYSANYVVNEQVTSITKKDDLFIVKGNLEYISKYVIFAVGGKSQSHFGSDGKSYSLIEGFGHKVTKLYPSLVQLKCDKEKIKGLSGVKQTANVSLLNGQKVVKMIKGDILFTDNGVSGNTIFFLSSYATDIKCSLSIEFAPTLKKEQLFDSLKAYIKNFGFLKSEVLLSNITHGRISSLIMKDVCPSKKLADITDEEIKNAINILKDYRINVEGTLGFENSQVTRGGIVTSDVDAESMESKLVDNLYIVGEVLDVDGDCGGYNLQWAFSSSMSATESIINKWKK